MSRRSRPAEGRRRQGRGRCRGGDRHLRRRDHGQATVELALCLPVVCLLLLAVVQVGLVVRDQVLLIHAARESARTAAVDASPAAAQAAAVRAGPLDARRLSVSVSGGRSDGDDVRVVARYRSATDVPLVGALLGDVTLQAEVTMRAER